MLAQDAKKIMPDIPEMGIRTVNGIASHDSGKEAWFKDTEGNILSLSQHG